MFKIRHFLKLHFYYLKYLLSCSQTVMCSILIWNHSRTCTTAQDPVVTPNAFGICSFKENYSSWNLATCGSRSRLFFLAQALQQTQQTGSQASILGRPLCSLHPTVCSSVLWFNQSMIMDQIHLGDRKCLQKWKIGGICGRNRKKVFLYINLQMWNLCEWSTFRSASWI